MSFFQLVSKVSNTFTKSSMDKSLKHLHQKFYGQSELLQLILRVLRLDWFAQLLMRGPIWSLAVFATVAGAFTACTAA